MGLQADIGTSIDKAKGGRRGAHRRCRPRVNPQGTPCRGRSGRTYGRWMGHRRRSGRHRPC
jgi:hypothetical protein